MKSKLPPRFVEFRSALRANLGLHTDLLADGETVLIAADTFSSATRFHTLQSAIDHFARYMPEHLLG